MNAGANELILRVANNDLEGFDNDDIERACNDAGISRHQFSELVAETQRSLGYLVPAADMTYRLVRLPMADTFHNGSFDT